MPYADVLQSDFSDRCIGSVARWEPGKKGGEKTKQASAFKPDDS